MRRICLALVLLAWTGLAWAGPAQKLAQDKMEASMPVTGDIQVDAQGEVAHTPWTRTTS